MAPTPSPSTVLDQLATLLESLRGSWPGEGSAAAAPSPPKAEEAETMAQRARRKYDRTLRWVLGIFSAIGLLVFGSLPFTDLGDVDPTLLSISLGAVGLGLAIVIVATATGVELQDASLGELARTFEHRSTWRWWSYVLTPWRRPLVVANSELKAILENEDPAEAQAHLGPGARTVEDLIARLGEVERVAMQAYIGWDGNWIVDPGAATPVDGDGLLAAVGDSVAAKLARAELAHLELERLAKVRAALQEQLPAPPEPPATPEPPAPGLLAAIAATESSYAAVAAALPEPDYLDQAATSKALDELRDHYRAHRKLVLQESLVAQIRGKFRIALCWLLLGAVLTGAGGIGYAYTVANPTTDGSVDNPVTVTLDKDTDAFQEFTDAECWAGEPGGPVAPALLVRSTDTDGLQDGDFTFMPLSGTCAGKTFDVDEGDGTYAAWTAPEQETPDPPADAPPRTGWRVNVTILPGTPAYRSLRGCITRASDVRGVAGRLLGASDADDDQDGPFTVVLLAGRCAARTVFVRDADGKYRVLTRKDAPAQPATGVN